jgi:Asp/Glu/hydantoin racemase
MKIWIQSCAPLHHETRSDYQKALKRHAKRVARPGTTVEFHGVDVQIPGMTTSYTGESVCGWQSGRNAIRAEREGYDAFFMSSVPDSCYYGIKEMVDIPVVFITEASLHVALMLGHKVAFMTINPFFLARLMDIAKRYGLVENLVQGGCVDISYASDLPIMFKKPASYVDKASKTINEIASRGANIIIPGPVPLSMFLLEQGVREVGTARILDIFTCGLKMTELMVDLKESGMVRSKHGLFSAPPKELMPELRKLYQVNFEIG